MKVKCRYTNEEIDIKDAIKIGATIPGVIAQYYMKNTSEVRELHKQQQIAFHESEANCNTCANMERIKHEKSKFGFLKIKCCMDNKIKTIHPDDPMFMSCYKSRWENK